MPTLNSLIHPHNMKVQLNDGSVLNFVSVDNVTKKVTAKDDNGNIIILDPTDVKKFEFSLFEAKKRIKVRLRLTMCVDWRRHR